MIQLLAGATDYPGYDYGLPDCELDCSRVKEAFKPFAKVKTLTAKRPTYDALRAAVQSFARNLKPSDFGLLYWSGHGTVDSINGRRVEAIVCYGGELYYDFEMRADLNLRPDGAMIAALVDACHSGGLPRGHKGRVRKLPIADCVRRSVSLPARSPAKPNAIFSACKATELAYSTGDGGAMTLAFLKAFKQRKDKTTLPALFKAIQKELPSDEWPQTPQFVCDDVLAGRTLKSFVGK